MGISNFLRNIYVKVGYRLWGVSLWNVWPFTKRVINDWDNYVNLSFSQEGEDLILSRLIGDKKNGFYIDIGAHHPYRFSNTFKFYLKGWRGINIDPLPGSMILFNKYRPNDINIEVAINNFEENEQYYFMFAEPALNTMNEDVAVSRMNSIPEDKIINKILVKSYKLETLLDKYLSAEAEIDFITIDVEGMDFDVIKSNNWNRYRPKYLIIESIRSTIIDDLQSDVSIYLNIRGYDLTAKTANSLIYIRSKFRL